MADGHSNNFRYFIGMQFEYFLLQPGVGAGQTLELQADFSLLAEFALPDIKRIHSLAHLSTGHQRLAHQGCGQALGTVCIRATAKKPAALVEILCP